MKLKYSINGSYFKIFLKYYPMMQKVRFLKLYIKNNNRFTISVSL